MKKPQVEIAVFSFYNLYDIHRAGFGCFKIAIQFIFSDLYTPESFFVFTFQQHTFSIFTAHAPALRSQLYTIIAANAFCSLLYDGNHYRLIIADNFV